MIFALVFGVACGIVGLIVGWQAGFHDGAERENARIAAHLRAVLPGEFEDAVMTGIAVGRGTDQ